MAEIVIASGKGGVGKSTLTSSISVLLQDRKIGIVDGDAEAPNLHIIFDVNTWESEVEYREKSIAEIDYSKCINCLLCKETCTYEAIREKDGIPSIKGYVCEGCGACKVVCPNDAISIQKNILSGWIRIGKTKYGPFVSSELDVGQPNSGKLVTSEKNIARKWVIDGLIKNIIVDSAAGIGCQVIASLSGATHALLVVEPTKSSLSDLKRVYYLAQHFRIKSFVVVNRYNLNPDFSELHDFVSENGLEIVGKIPYDKTVAESMAKRKPLVEYDPHSPASKTIHEISSFVDTLLS
ncbi:MAG: ATP-binding protein [Thermoplasmatales archaeon]|nr:ATP-binding protein [Thermoplasmatales archaeon]